MHDPMSLVWRVRIPLPWFRGPKFIERAGERVRNPFRRRASIPVADIWHVDPETDGSDDSCSERKRLPRRHHDVLDHMAWSEARDPWFQRERAKRPTSPADAETLLRGALWDVARATRLNRWSLFHRRVTFAACAQLASELLHNNVDNVRGSLCLLPGWHTNDRKPGVEFVEVDINDDKAMDRERARPATDDAYPAEASAWAREEASKDFFRMCARILSRRTARWWQRPRWHVHHWSIRITAWQWFRRRFIERCSTCGVRYRGSSNVYTDWHGTRTWCAKCQGASGAAKAAGSAS